MAITMDERKDRYYKLVVKKGSAIYSLWGNSGTISKQIVAKANEYAFDERLKSDYSYRFQVLAFTYALELRLEKRYKGFFRKLFRLFAYLRETEACRLLKRVMGFSSATPMLEMISVEMERLAMRLSERDDDQTAGGGKRVGASDMTLEEGLQSILGENVQEEQKTEEKDVNSAEKDGAEVQATDEQQKAEDGRLALAEGHGISAHRHGAEILRGAQVGTALVPLKEGAEGRHTEGAGKIGAGTRPRLAPIGNHALGREGRHAVGVVKVNKRQGTGGAGGDILCHRHAPVKRTKLKLQRPREGILARGHKAGKTLHRRASAATSAIIAGRSLGRTPRGE